jgi:hypothetical protein
MSRDYPPRKAESDFARISDVRREMARIYWLMEGKKIESQDGSRLQQALLFISKVVEQEKSFEVVEKLERLESGASLTVVK